MPLFLLISAEYNLKSSEELQLVNSLLQVKIIVTVQNWRVDEVKIAMLDTSYTCHIDLSYGGKDRYC